jgi:hypothetical protein
LGVGKTCSAFAPSPITDQGRWVGKTEENAQLSHHLPYPTPKLQLQFSRLPLTAPFENLHSFTYTQKYTLASAVPLSSNDQNNVLNMCPSIDEDTNGPVLNGTASVNGSSVNGTSVNGSNVNGSCG